MAWRYGLADVRMGCFLRMLMVKICGMSLKAMPRRNPHETHGGDRGICYAQEWDQ